MPLNLDMCRMQSTSTGIGNTITLDAVVDGFVSFQTELERAVTNAEIVAVDGTEVYVAIEQASTNAAMLREVGRWRYNEGSPATLTRLEIYQSTNSGNAISLEGAAQLFSAPLKEGVGSGIAESDLLHFDLSDLGALCIGTDDVSIFDVENWPVHSGLNILAASQSFFSINVINEANAATTAGTSIAQKPDIESPRWWNFWGGRPTQSGDVSSNPNAPSYWVGVRLGGINWVSGTENTNHMVWDDAGNTYLWKLGFYSSPGGQAADWDINLFLKAATPTTGDGSWWELQFPTNAGTNGYVLQTDGTGITSWVSPGVATMAVGSAIAGGAAGSVLFEDASNQLGENNSNFYWDNVNARLGVGVGTGPAYTVDVGGSNNTEFSITSSNTLGASFRINAANGGEAWQFFSAGSGNGTGICFGAYNETQDTIPWLLATTNVSPGVFNAFQIMLAGGVYGWSSDTQYDKIADLDTGVSRVAPLIVGVGNGAAGDISGTLQLTNLYVAPVTIAALPGSPSVGDVAAVSDGDPALAWGATAVNSGAGATQYLVWYNGAAWTVFGK